MGRPAGWMRELTGRSLMKSPGAPSLRREVEREFWRGIAAGVTSGEAAAAVGVSEAAGSRWFRHGGGMPTVDIAPLSGRYLSFHEREEIALLRPPLESTQYTSLEFSTRLTDWGIAPSFSRTGNCFDNAAIESTWVTIKREFHHIYGDYSQMTRSQLRNALFSYIETFYNRQRHQARLGHRTPADVYANHAA